MRASVVVVLVLALGAALPAPPAAAAPAWTPNVAAAQQYAATRAGSVSIAGIGTDGRLVGFRSATRVPMASVLKVMFMTAYLRQPSVRDRALGQSDRALLEPMIRWSDNATATQIANRLGPGPLYDLAAAAGMQDFSYTRPWGLSTTSARDQARFMRDLDRHLPARHRAYALDLLTRVVASQRWGIGALDTPGWSRHFKGGWGSGSGAVDHQVVRLRYGDGTAVSLAVMTTGNPSHAYATATLREVFRRLLAGLPDPRPSGAVDIVSGGPGAVRVRGWAFDRDAPTAPIRVHAYVGGRAGQPGAVGRALVADGPRPDVGRVYPGVGDHHGFSATFATPKRGRQPVCLYAINVGPGSHRELGCRTVTIGDPNPRGALDLAVGGSGTVRVGGWAWDPNAPTQPLRVHVYVGGQDGTAAHGFSFVAERLRADVGRVFPGVGDHHGYDTTLVTSKRGSQRVCVHAINVGPGGHRLLGCPTVTIAPPAG